MAKRQRLACAMNETDTAGKNATRQETVRAEGEVSQQWGAGKAADTGVVIQWRPAKLAEAGWRVWRVREGTQALRPATREAALTTERQVKEPCSLASPVIARGIALLWRKRGIKRGLLTRLFEARGARRLQGKPGVCGCGRPASLRAGALRGGAGGVGGAQVGGTPRGWLLRAPHAGGAYGRLMIQV